MQGGKFNHNRTMDSLLHNALASRTIVFGRRLGLSFGPTYKTRNIFKNNHFTYSTLTCTTFADSSFTRNIDKHKFAKQINLGCFLQTSVIYKQHFQFYGSWFQKISPTL